MKIYVFGNPLVPEDSQPLKFIDELSKTFPQVVFKIVDPNENFPPKEEKDLVILDTVKGIKEPMILYLDDFDPPVGRKKTLISPHDYDLLFHLLLLKKLKRIKKVIFLCVPSFSDRKKMVPMTRLINQLKALIKLIFL